MRDVVSIPVTVKTRIGIDDQDSYEFLCEFINTVSGRGECEMFIIHARKAWLSGLSPKENREIPPLDYPRVYQLKRDFPHLTMSINGGIKSLEEARAHLEHMDGVMVGREAYQNPGILTSVDREIFGIDGTDSDPVSVVRAMYPYIERELSNGVVTRRSVGIDLAHTAYVVMIMGMTTIVKHVFVFYPIVIQLAEDLLWRDAQLNTKVIHQLEFAVFVDARKQRHFGIGRATLHQRTAGVVADAANHRGPYAGRSNHRVGLAPQRLKRFFQRVEGSAWEGQHLLAFVQHVQFIQTQGTDDNDIAVVVVAVGGRAFGKTGIGCLHQDDFIRLNASAENAPQLQQRTREDHREGVALAGTEPFTIAGGFRRIGQQMGRPHQS
jgi:hypothetical protein